MWLQYEARRSAPWGRTPPLTFQFPSDWMSGFCTTLNHKELVPHCVSMREAGSKRCVDWVKVLGFREPIG